jgi:hypothetical protein
MAPIAFDHSVETLASSVKSGHVGLAEKLHLVAKPPHDGLQAPSHIAELDQPRLQPGALLVGLRIDLACEAQVCLLVLGVGGVA